MLNMQAYMTVYIEKKLLGRFHFIFKFLQLVSALFIPELGPALLTLLRAPQHLRPALHDCVIFGITTVSTAQHYLSESYTCDIAIVNTTEESQISDNLLQIALTHLGIWQKLGEFRLINVRYTVMWRGAWSALFWSEDEYPVRCNVQSTSAFGHLQKFPIMTHAWVENPSLSCELAVGGHGLGTPLTTVQKRVYGHPEKDVLKG